MVSALDFIKDGDLLNWKKKGYFRNMRAGAPIAADSYLMSFFWPVADSGTSVTISSFQLRHINEKGVCTIYDLGTTNISITNNGNKNVAIYNGNQNILGTIGYYGSGAYQYIVNISTGRGFYSEVFWVNSQLYAPSPPPPAVGDFNADFNIDFFK